MKKPGSRKRRTIVEAMQDNPASAYTAGNTLIRNQQICDSLAGHEADRPLAEMIAARSDLFLFAYAVNLRSLVSWSDNCRDVLGIRESRIARDGNLFFSFMHQDDRFEMQNKFESALSGDGDLNVTYRWIRPDNNEIRWLHCRATLKSSGKMNLLEGFIIDITRQLDRPLRYLSDFDSAARILSALPGLFIIMDRDCRIISISDRPDIKNFGFGDLLFRHEIFAVGHKLSDCICDIGLQKHLDNARKIVQGIGHKSYSFRITDKGKDFLVTLGAIPQQTDFCDENSKGIICRVEDITLLVNLENRVRELQKSASLHVLSSEIGHHINNALQTIIGQASLVSANPSDPLFSNTCADSIVATSLRLSELIRTLFNQPDNSTIQFSITDLNLAVSQAVYGSDKFFLSGFEVSMGLGQIPLIKTDYKRLVVLLETVLRDARSVLLDKESNKDYISIRTYTDQLTDSESDNHESAQYAVLSISDSRADTDNFQSSAAALKAAAEDLGAQIRFHPNKPCGVCLEIYFPSADLTALQSMKSECKNEAPPLLIIDDDPFVLSSLQSMLATLGCDSAVASGSQDAIARLKDFKSSIELVLLDSLLPEEDSYNLLKKLRQISPDIRIVAFTGAPLDKSRSLIEGGVAEVLRKPLMIADLKELLRKHGILVPQKAVSNG